MCNLKVLEVFFTSLSSTIYLRNRSEFFPSSLPNTLIHPSTQKKSRKHSGNFCFSLFFTKKREETLFNGFCIFNWEIWNKYRYLCVANRTDRELNEWKKQYSFNFVIIIVSDLPWRYILRSTAIGIAYLLRVSSMTRQKICWTWLIMYFQIGGEGAFSWNVWRVERIPFDRIFSETTGNEV